MADAKAKGGAKTGIWTLYKISGGNLERKNLFCPKCGTGFFLAQHENRLTCGKCGYCEFVSKKKE